MDDVERAGLSCELLSPDDGGQAEDVVSGCVAGVEVDHVFPHTVEGVTGAVAVDMSIFAAYWLDKTER